MRRADAFTGGAPGFRRSMPIRLEHRLPAPWKTRIGPCDPCVAVAIGSQRGHGEQVPVLLVDRDDRAYSTCARWGWPRTAGLLSVFAPVESAATDPLWREAGAARRTAVPVSGWLDADGWRYGPLRATEILFLAGLWRRDDDGLSVALLDQLALPGFIDDGVGRMPIALDQELAVNWILGLPTGRALTRQCDALVATPPAE